MALTSWCNTKNNRTMTNQEQIEITAQAKALQIGVYIKKFVAKGKHQDKGAINLKAVSERSGIPNLGFVLRQKGITMCRVFRVLEALRELCDETGTDITPLHDQRSNLIKH